MRPGGNKNGRRPGMLKRYTAAAALLAAMALAAPHADAGEICLGDEECRCFRDRDVDFVDGVLVIESDSGEWVVKIDEDYGLYVNGAEADLDRGDRSLVRRYHRRMEKVHRMIREIAADGAEIGVEGAKIGLMAIAGLARLVLDDYDSDDLEREIDDDAGDIERLAGRLERKAERLEEEVEELEKLHEKLGRSVRELRELEGF